jgi:hypothetical protein
MSDNFIAEFAEIDLSEIKHLTFGVAPSIGPRDGVLFECKNLLAPLSFYEMVETAAMMHKNHGTHAKVFILNKDSSKKMKFLDEQIVDFIEARYEDIITESILEPDANKEYDMKASFFEAPDEEING